MMLNRKGKSKWLHHLKILRYLSFRKIQTHPSRYLRPRLMSHIGILDDINTILVWMELDFLLNYGEVNYPKATKQVLATLEVRYKHPRKKELSEWTLYFKIEQNPFSLSMNEVCEAYGFTNGSTIKFPKFQDAEIFWKVIASGPLKSGSTKAALIKNPIISIIHKLLANTIFTRYDESQIQTGELCLLFQDLKYILTDDEGNSFRDNFGDDMNLGCVFAKELVSFCTWAINTSHPDLFIGGVLVPLFKKSKVHLHAFHYEDTGST